MTRMLRAFLPLFLCLVLAAPAMAGHGDERPVKKGILLVAFGTTVPEAKASLDNVDKLVKAAFPGVPVHWAYSSKIIRRALGEKKQTFLSPAEALAQMMEEDFTHVAVQSLHTIPGEEYHALVKTAHAFAGMPKGMERVLTGYPLLSTTDDVKRVVDAMTKHFPKERKKDEAVILMGHGAHHPGNIYYPGVQYFFWKKDPNTLVGTVEGAPDLDDVQAELKKRNIKKAWLLPFMAVAGDHAMNDMAGDEPDSWKSVLTKAGVKCIPVLKGTASYDDVAAVWVDHLKAAFAHFPK